MKGIIFTAPMVRALLEKRKPVTRRLQGLEEINKNPDHWKFYNSLDGIFAFRSGSCADDCDIKFAKPPYRPGEIVYVRETWAITNLALDPVSLCNLPQQISVYAGGIHDYDLDPWLTEKMAPRVIYRADLPQRLSHLWRPSIHLPEKYARLKLEIVDVRPERVQEITEEEAIKEGAILHGFGFNSYGLREPGWSMKSAGHPDECFETARWAFGALWQSLYGPDSWAENPWVWRTGLKEVWRKS
jgi:hypothetical protein